MRPLAAGCGAGICSWVALLFPSATAAGTPPSFKGLGSLPGELFPPQRRPSALRPVTRVEIQPLQLDAANIHEHIHYTFAPRGEGSGEVEKTEEGFVIHLSGGDERTMVIARQKERIPKHFGPVARSNHITGLQVLPMVHIRAEPAWRWRIGEG
jgi:hypothetical protein